MIGVALIYSQIGFAAGIAYFPPPLQQIRDGIEPTYVTCTEGLELVFKLSNKMPACIKPSSIEKLINMNWEIHVLPDVDAISSQNSEIISLGTYDVDASEIEYDGFAGYLVRPSETSCIACCDSVATSSNKSTASTTYPNDASCSAVFRMF